MTHTKRERIALTVSFVAVALVALTIACLGICLSGCGSFVGNPIGGGYTPRPNDSYPLLPNYLNLSADIRWRQPIVTVAIDHTHLTLPIGNREKAAWAGVMEWQEALSGIVTLQQVDSCDTADVCIRFVKGGDVENEPPVRHPSRGPLLRWLDDAFPSTLGMTWVSTDASGLTATEADCQIAESIVTDQRTTSVVAHEFGHALGLRLHSPSSLDLMYQFPPEHGLTQRDYNSQRSNYLRR